MYDLGLKVIKKMCEAQEPMQWYRAKLSEQLFRGPEVSVFQWVDNHVRKYHALPTMETLLSQHPILMPVQAPEPVLYYVERVENAYFHSLINQANIDSQQQLKDDQDNWVGAKTVMQECLAKITQQQYRTRIMDVTKEAPLAVLTEYHGVGKPEHTCGFGWEYMDTQSGGVVPGDVISFVGRPAQGKSWMMLYISMHNWITRKKNVLFVSMEMATIAVAQRVASMYAHVPYGQLKQAGFSSQTYQKFVGGLKTMQMEGHHLYVVDGNLAMGVREIYELADLLECELVVIDGAYLTKHPDKRLDRFTRVAENVELMKRVGHDFAKATFASWQFNRTAAKLKKGEKAGLEDIGMSDAIPQVSSIVLGMEQEESVETMFRRRISVMKGRSGEVGSFDVNWEFNTMDFSQAEEEKEEAKQLEYI